MTKFDVDTQIIETETLLIACEISGPESGKPIILLHGWPDDVRTWDGILPALHADNWRTYVPYLRGFGLTGFKPNIQPTGQLAALGQDVLDMAAKLGLERFAVAGHDWGGRAAYIASCLAPESITHCIALSVGWGTNDPEQHLSLRQSQNYWYHWLMATPRGEDLVRYDREAFTRYIWDIWTPHWKISEEEFARTASAFNNPAWSDVVLHSYRVRWGLATPDPSYTPTEQLLQKSPTIRIPTLVIHGRDDPCNDPSTSADRESYFTAQYRRQIMNEVGHFPQREKPDEVADLMIEFLRTDQTAFQHEARMDQHDLVDLVEN